jgi:PncC family amidohydrolase
MSAVRIDTLAHDVAAALASHHLTLSVAESCTGGLVGAAITSVAGSSLVFVGGVIAYSNDVKASVLGVAQETLDRHGAVSRETVVAMAAGVRRLTGSECAIAVSGVAGPGGGTAKKPVGLVWIAVAVRESVQTVECHLTGDRHAVREQAVEKALEVLLSMIRGLAS